MIRPVSLVLLTAPIAGDGFSYPIRENGLTLLPTLSEIVRPALSCAVSFGRKGPEWIEVSRPLEKWKSSFHFRLQAILIISLPSTLALPQRTRRLTITRGYLLRNGRTGEPRDHVAGDRRRRRRRGEGIPHLENPFDQVAVLCRD